ncbi:MAG: hypothetical protein QM661_11130 [Solimonas sp.]
MTTISGNPVAGSAADALSVAALMPSAAATVAAVWAWAAVAQSANSGKQKSSVAAAGNSLTARSFKRNMNIPPKV